jgi:hypothetical protein
MLDTTLNLIAIERFHPMISSNILPNFLSNFFLSLLSEKSLKKKTLHNTIFQITAPQMVEKS